MDLTEREQRGGRPHPGRRFWTLAAGVLIGAALLCGCSKSRDPQAYIEKLKSEKEDTRKDARGELIRMHEEALPAVKEAFKGAGDSPEDIRLLSETVHVLQEDRDVETLRLVGSRIDDTNAEIRLAVIKGVASLAHVRKKVGIELLKKAMGDESSKCVRAAARGLQNLNFEDATALLERLFARGEGVPSIFAAEALYMIDRRSEAAQYLMEGLDSPEKEVADAAESAVVELGVKRGVGGEFVKSVGDYAGENSDARNVHKALEKIRDALIKELGRKLPPKRIRTILNSLGLIADEKSCEALIEQARDAEQIPARVAGADALGTAAASSRPAGTDPDLRARIMKTLRELLEDEEIDDRVRISAAISLCRLRREAGVNFLLSQLEALEKPPAGEEGESEKAMEGLKPEELTELRIRAQEALTSSGRFVVPYLFEALEGEKSGSVINWAAARTFGDLGVEESVPLLAEFLTATTPVADVAPHEKDPTGEWELDEDEAPDDHPAVSEGKFAPERQMILKQVFGEERVLPRHEPAVRKAAALSLGKIGGAEALEHLRRGREIHENASKALRAYIRKRGYVRLLPTGFANDDQRGRARGFMEKLCQHLLREQEGVLFYIRRGLKQQDEGD